MGSDTARRQIHQLVEDATELGLVDGAAGIDIKGQRLGDADRIGDLDRAVICDPRSDHVLREIARGVGGRAIDLGRVLARERPAAMWRPTTIGVDDDLAAGHPGIAIRTADDKTPGRINQEIIFIAHPSRGKRIHHEGPHDLADIALVEAVGMLDRHDHLGRTNRLSVNVLQRHLAFRIRAELRRPAGVAGLGKRAQNRMRVIDRRRHQIRRVVAGKAEHHALVAGAFVLVAGSIYALSDVAGLVVDEAADVGMLPVKILLLVANLADRLAGNLDQLLAGDRFWAAGLAGENDTVGRDQRLDAAACLRVSGQVGIDDRVGNPVADLVGVAFRHRLAGKYKIVLRQQTISLNRLEPYAGRFRAIDD